MRAALLTLLFAANRALDGLLTGLEFARAGKQSRVGSRARRGWRAGRSGEVPRAHGAYDSEAKFAMPVPFSMRSRETSYVAQRLKCAVPTSAR